MDENIRIKNLRMTLAMTTKDFGKILGLTSHTIKLIENSNKKVTDEIIKTICTEFGVDETWLRTGKGNMLKLVPENKAEILSQKYDLTYQESMSFS